MLKYGKFIVPNRPKPLYSIITVCLNHLDGLKNTHESLCAQSHKDYEWIVIDGGSEFETTEFLKTTNANWISEPDHGIYDAMNKGIERAKGAYLLFLNAGDQLAAPDVLETLAEAINKNNEPDFIYGDAIEDGQYKTAHDARQILSGLFTHHQAMLYKRTALGDLGYSLMYTIAADYEFTARFLQQNPMPLYINKPICIFETDGISQQNAALGRKEQFQIRGTLRMCGALENISIYIKQWLSWSLRRTAPRLYWALRTKR